MGWMDTDKVPAREMGVGFQKCANMPNTNAYSFNGGTDVVMCPFGWRNERKKNGQYTITGFKNNPAAITQNDPLDDYSIITGTILHEIYHTFMGNHNDVQVNINGQLQTAYGTYNCMQLALQNSAQTLDNCENIMLASIAMFLDGWDWYTGVATPL
ncbi:hypothetical protein BU16DRAFT_50600 [Lophium mytilinum]|uniref:Lysine-specific metallo-endopeptidase domain-containing protein n=1 Tax=Lophium mytilinum TaxID=390894 RepID=A0A6A6QR64_9PEZI|nr:hypothetical protein BU16DRAFT_50600 [Lophium mytilinum]